MSLRFSSYALFCVCVHIHSDGCCLHLFNVAPMLMVRIVLFLQSITLMCCVVKYWIHIYLRYRNCSFCSSKHFIPNAMSIQETPHSLSYVKEGLFKDVSSGQRFHKTSQILKFRAIIFIVKLLLSDVPFQGDSI